MTKKLWIVVAIVVLLASVFPVGVNARDKAEVKVWIRNSTGGVVELRLTDGSGNNTFQTVEPGVFEYAMAEGGYDYYARTVCGNYAGHWNFNVSKTLILKCIDGLLAIESPYKCEDKGWYATDDWGLWYLSWTKDGHYTYPNPSEFLEDVTGGWYYLAWWECWDPKSGATYGW